MTFSEELEEKLRAGSEWQDNGLVFANSKGTSLEAQNVMDRHFKPLLKRARGCLPSASTTCGIVA